jgi:hypothetical protein
MKKSTFVNVDLSTMQVLRYEHLCSNVDDWSFTLSDLVLLGYKVSVTPKQDGTGLNVALTDRREKSDNKGVTLACWSDTIGEAFRKLEVVLHLSIEQTQTWSATVENLRKETSKDIDQYKEFLDWKRAQTNVDGSRND